MEIANEISSHERHMVAEVLGVSKGMVDKVLNGTRESENIKIACEKIVDLRKVMMNELAAQMNSMVINHTYSN